MDSRPNLAILISCGIFSCLAALCVASDRCKREENGLASDGHRLDKKRKQELQQKAFEKEKSRLDRRYVPRSMAMSSIGEL
jgi:hypothetical protein